VPAFPSTASQYRHDQRDHCGQPVRNEVQPLCFLTSGALTGVMVLRSIAANNGLGIAASAPVPRFA